MKKYYENALVRINAVLNVCESNKPVWQNSAPFNECVADLFHLKTRIDTERMNIDPTTTGVTKAKIKAEKALANESLSLSASLMAYAVRTNNDVLYARVKTTKRELGDMRDNQLIAKGRLLVAEAQLRPEELSGYLAKADAVAQLEAAIANFEALAPAPQRTIGDNKTKREDLGDLIKQANALMREVLDRMVIPYESVAADFYRAYQNARKTVKFGTRYNDDENAEAGTNNTEE